MPQISQQYAPEYYRNAYNRETLEKALADHRDALENYSGKDSDYVATLAHRIGMMEAELWRRGDLVRQGSR